MTLAMVADYLDQVIPAHEPDAASMLQDVRDAIQRANRVISELLEFSRPGELTLKPEDFHAIVDRALSLVKLEMARHHIDVVRRFGEALPALPMDKNKMEQVLVNIFMNAIQVMPQGGTFTIRTSTAPVGQGTGLGLCVARQIVQLHGGTIEPCNRAEGGVRVTIVLNPKQGN